MKRTTDDFLRPDEQNLAKEIRLAARETELYGKMTPKKARIYRHRIRKAEKQYGYNSSFFRETEIECITPHDLSARPKNR